MVAIDRYLAPGPPGAFLVEPLVEPAAMTGIAQIAAVYVGLTLFSFLLDSAGVLLQWAEANGDVRLTRRNLPPPAAHAYRVLRQEIPWPAGHARHHRRGRAERNVHFRSGLDFEDIFVLAGILAIMLCLDWKLR